MKIHHWGMTKEKNLTLGDVGFDCTHPLGVRNCPIHKDNPNAGLHDCRYGKPAKIVNGAISLQGE